MGQKLKSTNKRGCVYEYFESEMVGVMQYSKSEMVGVMHGPTRFEK
jgi:hypothetical protein